jgi:hypothetical protein
MRNRIHPKFWRRLRVITSFVAPQLKGYLVHNLQRKTTLALVQTLKVEAPISMFDLYMQSIEKSRMSTIELP